MSLIFSQENDLWQAVLTERDAVKRQQQLVEMAKLLLEKANPSADENLAVEELVDLLLEYQHIGHYTANFFDATIPYINEEYQQFAEQIQTLKNTLQDKTVQSQKIQAYRNQLETQRQQLLSAIATLQQLPEVEILEQQVITLQTQLEQLQQYANQVSLVQQEKVQLEQDMALNIIAIFPSIIQLLQTHQAMYPIHFAENVDIKMAMISTDELTEAATLLEQTATLSENISRSLQTFDDLLRQLVDIAERKRFLMRELRDRPT